MHIWSTNFLRKNKVLFSYQFGFQNNYSTNVSKTDFVIFRSLRKQITKRMIFHLSGQKIRQKHALNILL